MVAVRDFITANQACAATDTKHHRGLHDPARDPAAAPATRCREPPPASPPVLAAAQGPRNHRQGWEWCGCAPPCGRGWCALAESAGTANQACAAAAVAAAAASTATAATATANTAAAVATEAAAAATRLGPPPGAGEADTAAATAAAFADVGRVQ